MKLPNFPPDYRPHEIFRPDLATSDSAPRAVASEAFERGLLMEPRSLPLAVLKARLFIAFSTKPVCGCDSLFRRRLAFLLTFRKTGGLWPFPQPKKLPNC
jgi:hypothetical protein